MIRIKLCGDIYPDTNDIELLGTVITDENGVVYLELDEQKYKIIKNSDVEAISEQDEFLKEKYKDLMYLIVDNSNLVASGNISFTNDGYVCNGPFRIFKNYSVKKMYYAHCADIDVSELLDVNDRLINASNPASKVK